MRTVTASLDELRSLRDNDAALFGLPDLKSGTLWRWSIVRRGNQFFYPVDEDLWDRRSKLDPENLSLVESSTNDWVECPGEELVI